MSEKDTTVVPESQGAHPSLFDKVQWLQDVLKDERLTQSAKLIATKLALHHHNSKTGRCDPGVPLLAKGIGLAVRATHDALANLTASGWIAVEKRSGMSNAYRLQRVTITRQEERPVGRPMQSTARVVVQSAARVPMQSTAHEHQNQHQNENTVSPPTPSERGPVEAAPRRSGRIQGERVQRTSMPEGFRLDAKRAQIGTEAGLPASELTRAFEGFISHAKANGRTYADWDEAWRGWSVEAARRHEAPKKRRALV